MLSPGLISPSSCITAAKFRRFTRNYHQQPSAPGLSEQVNDLSPGLCPRVTAITAGSASSQRSLPPHRETLFIHPPPPKIHTGVCAPISTGAPLGGHGTGSRRGHLPGVISQAWDIGKTPSIPPPPRLWQGGRGWLRTDSADVAGCPTSPGSRGTKLLPCFQSDSGAGSPRRARMPPGPSAAAAEPTGDGVFRRVFQTSA